MCQWAWSGPSRPISATRALTIGSHPIWVCPLPYRSWGWRKTSCQVLWITCGWGPLGFKGAVQVSSSNNFWDNGASLELMVTKTSQCSGCLCPGCGCMWAGLVIRVMRLHHRKHEKVDQSVETVVPKAVGYWVDLVSSRKRNLTHWNLTLLESGKGLCTFAGHLQLSFMFSVWVYLVTGLLGGIMLA